MKTLSRNEYIAVAVGLIGVMVVLFMGNRLFNASSQTTATDLSAEETVASKPDLTSASASVTVRDTLVGQGSAVKIDDVVWVHYIGTLTDGTQFDSSYERGEPISFTVGAGDVVPGFDAGVIGMKVGGKRQVTIPAEYGFGAQAVGDIPPNSTLVFAIELVKIGQ